MAAPGRSAKNSVGKGINMNWKIAAPVAACLTLSSIHPAMAQHHHWGYSGEVAPQNWGQLDPEFATCATGKSQSPIDLRKPTRGDPTPIRLDYKKGTTEILNNGHTVQVNYQPGSSLTLDGRSFELKQFHFHAPSENTVNGKHFPLEGHLVHEDKDGNLAVIAVMFREGPANPFIASLWKMMPTKEGEDKALAEPLSVLQMLPAERHYYLFTGSLTTPPCSEGVRWLVLQKAMSASKAQIDAFVKAVGFPNNRPVQPLNARQVLSQ
jgi:carbonic anhydrase